MSLLVTGSIGIDTVETPFGTSENCLGGSAVYFSMAASYFAPVRFIGAIGADCPFDLHEFFHGREIDLTGLEIRQMSKTFRWKGSYFGRMNEAITNGLELNVLAEDPPAVPELFRDSKYIFLANTNPMLQMQLLEQLEKPLFVAADTMNCWIERSITDLKSLLKNVHALVLNEDEARALAQEENLIQAGRKILEMGPEFTVIKKGESGSIICKKSGEKFLLPAYPADVVKDPTGAGDSFAGAMMGYLANVQNIDFENLKKAVAYGTVAASFTIADFSVDGISKIKRADIDDRFELLKKMTQI